MDVANGTATAIECSAQELYFLAAILGGDMLLGVDDPFPGWLTEEIAEEMQRIDEVLTERGLVMRGEAGAIVAPELAPLARALAFPVATVLLSGSTPDGGIAQGAIFLAESGGAHLTRTGELDYRLENIGGVTDAHTHIVERWGLDDQPAAGTAGVAIPEDALREARVHAETGAGAAGASLEAAGVPTATAAALAETLANPIRNGAVATVRRGDVAWHTGGLAVLEGASGMWRLRAVDRNGVPWVEVEPMGAEALRAELRTVLEACLPAPVGATNGVGRWTG